MNDQIGPSTDPAAFLAVTRQKYVVFGCIVGAKLAFGTDPCRTGGEDVENQMS